MGSSVLPQCFLMATVPNRLQSSCCSFLYVSLFEKGGIAMRKCLFLFLVAVAIGVGLNAIQANSTSLSAASVSDAEAAEILGGCASWTSGSSSCSGCPATRYYAGTGGNQKSQLWTCGGGTQCSYQQGPLNEDCSSS